MKKKWINLSLASLLVLVSIQMSSADETVTEKVSGAAHSAKRGMNKGANRVSESVCSDGKASCTGEKVKNRVIEAKDATVDKAKEIKNKID